MTRKQAIDAIREAGIHNDQISFIRLYIENRISLPVARAEFEDGRQFAQFFASHDARLRED